MKKEFQTSRYSISVEEIGSGGPAGYESVYLTSEGDLANEELYTSLSSFNGRALPIENKTIRQRNGLLLIESIKEGKSIGIASGFKPSGAYHFGHKLTSSVVSFFQKNGTQVFIPVADVECEMDTAMSRKNYLYWAADNLLDWGANGVNLDAAHVYLQSEERRVNDLAYVVARSLTFDFAIDTYGFEKLCGNPNKKNDKGEFPFLFAGITQVGDIILPQHPDFGNHHSFMVSGQDQDGHMKMTIGLVESSIGANRIIPGLQTIPSGFYIPHIRGLFGGKQSSSKQNGTLFLGSGPDKLGLEKRIEFAESSIDDMLSDSNLVDGVKKCALDIVRYIDFFNQRSIVDFKGLLNDMPESLKRKLNEDLNEEIKTQLIDDYLIEECERVGQDNVGLMRDLIKDSLKDHQNKRQKILNYALEKADYKIVGAWNTDDMGLIQPEFWDVPEKAIVDESQRNLTEWYHLVSAMRNEIIA